MATAERTDFLKSLASYKTEAAKTAKVAASSGYLEDTEIIEALGLVEGENSAFVARLSRFNYGKDKNKQPYFQPRFTIVEGAGKGTPVSDYLGMPKSDKDRTTRSWESVYRYLQRMDVDTTEWTSDVLAKTVDACDQLSASRPFVRLSLSIYQKRNSKGVAEGDPRLNISIIGLASPPEHDDSEEVEEETEEYEDVEGEEEVEVEVEEEESEGEESEEYAPKDYVGYTGTIISGDDSLEGTASAYDAKAKTFAFTVEGYGEDFDGDYEVSFEDITWDE